jgi:dipeptidyl-peptidase-4
MHRSVARLSLVLLLLASPAAAWDPFDRLPNADRVRKAQGTRLPVGPGVSDVRWDPDGGTVFFRRGDSWFRQPIEGGPAEPAAEGDLPKAVAAENAPRRRRGGGADGPPPARGRQATRATSPDGKTVALHKAGNLFLANPDGSDERAVTTEGGGTLKFGSASWVYGEELDQDTAMWWSPDSRYLAFYRFDDSAVVNFLLLKGWTDVRTELDTEPYPKPGEGNPVAGLMVLDTRDGNIVTVDVGSDRQQYVYRVSWSPKPGPDGPTLLFHRTNRRQDTLELVAADPETGATRTVLTERQETWQKNDPEFRFLADGRRFIWTSEATGWAHYQLWSLDGGKLAQLTAGEWPVDGIVSVDETNGWLWFMGRSGEVKINPHLHRVRLDGSDGSLVTREDRHWSNPRISPDGSLVVATREFVDEPPRTQLIRASDGAIVATLAESEGDPWEKAGLAKPEFVELLAADGVTPLYGIVWKPADFDPSRRYPLVVETYGGPLINIVSSRMARPNPETEFGAIILSVDNRGTPGRGKAFEAATYLALGGADADDQAAAARQVAERPYVDPDRIAITGHSYGGYMACIALLRHPEVFAVGVSGAPPTDWRNYDTIYTERFMRTPQENPEGYDFGSCVRRAGDLKGKLLLVHGMVDDNVHPTNVFQLADALQSRNIPFEMMLFPRAGHGIMSPAHESVKWSFLVRHLGLMPAPAPTSKAAPAP